MNKDSLGKKVVDTSTGLISVYDVIGYVDSPCLILRDIKTGNERTIVIGSRESQCFEDFKEWAFKMYVEATSVGYDEVQNDNS